MKCSPHSRLSSKSGYWRILLIGGLDSFHILRHTAASLLHEKTHDLKGVQQFLRHSQIGTTADIYVHQSPTVVRKASELLASELDRVVVESKLVN